MNPAGCWYFFFFYDFLLSFTRGASLTVLKAKKLDAYLYCLGLNRVRLGLKMSFYV